MEIHHRTQSPFSLWDKNGTSGPAGGQEPKWSSGISGRNVLHFMQSISDEVSMATRICPTQPALCAVLKREKKRKTHRQSLSTDSDLWPPRWNIARRQNILLNHSSLQSAVSTEDWTMRLGKVGVVSVWEGWWVRVIGGAWACVLIPQVWLQLGLGIKCHVDAGHLKMLLGFLF